MYLSQLVFRKDILSEAVSLLAVLQALWLQHIWAIGSLFLLVQFSFPYS